MDCLEQCTLCPRDCKVNRRDGQRGVCGQTDKLVVARAALHMWEEPCISGENGSGAVFFSGCNMGCVFCQNQKIAAGESGNQISIKRLTEIFFELQKKKAHNINLVTPTHFVPQILEAIDEARIQGFSLPFVYNTSSYEKIETIKSLRDRISIYLPDFKYMDSELSRRYSHATDYSSYASRAIDTMVNQAGEPVFDEESGLMKRGVIVRHLLLPGCLEDSKKIIKYLYETFGNSIFISIMNQYTPMKQVANYPELNRKVKKKEYDALVDYAIELGVENGFIQEGETAKESFIPEFNGEGVLASEEK